MLQYPDDYMAFFGLSFKEPQPYKGTVVALNDMYKKCVRFEIATP